MKELTPEDFQRIAENEGAGLEPSEITGLEKDLEAYKQLMGLLDEGPDIGLRYDFTARLTRRIAAATDRRISLRWYVFSAVLVCAAFGLSYFFILLYDFRAAQHFIGFVGQFKWVLGFVLLVFLGVQYFDRKLSV
jgi:hypothetical protein